MSEMSKVEEVARAICAENCEDYEILPGIHKSVARAAIQAMRVPTFEMKNATYMRDWEAEEVYQSMIDAALKE